MITYTNESVWPDWTTDETAPDQPQAPSLASIAVGLSRLPRFAGQTPRYYTVLAHTYSVQTLVQPQNRVYALLHDAPEAICADVPTTWKTASAKDNEMTLLKRISTNLGLTWPWPAAAWEDVNAADYQCLMAEAHILGHRRAEEYWRKADISRKAMEETRARLDRLHQYQGMNPQQVEYVQALYSKVVDKALVAAKDFYGLAKA